MAAGLHGDDDVIGLDFRYPRQPWSRLSLRPEKNNIL